MNLKSEIIDRELNFLKKTAGTGNIIIEVGCYAGKSTVGLAENNVVITIDPLIGNYDLRNGASNDMEDVEELLLSRIKNKNIIWYKEKSEDILKWWNMEIDGIFIDGDHTTAAFTIDLEWIKHVKTGGFMAFHDYGCYADVTDLLNKKVCPKYKEIGRVRYLIIFRKY